MLVVVFLCLAKGTMSMCVEWEFGSVFSAKSTIPREYHQCGWAKYFASKRCVGAKPSMLKLDIGIN